SRNSQHWTNDRRCNVCVISGRCGPIQERPVVKCTQPIMIASALALLAACSSGRPPPAPPPPPPLAAPMPPPEEPYVAPAPPPRRAVRHAHKKGKYVHHKRHRAYKKSSAEPASMAPMPAPAPAPSAGPPPSPPVQGPR